MLLDIVKQIVAKYGEQILFDPKRVNAFFLDLAKNEPKPQKLAFMDCLKQEHGVVKILQGVAKEDLTKCKESLAQMLSAEEVRNIELYREAIDILCEVLFGDNVVSEMKDNRTNIKYHELFKDTTAECQDVAKTAELTDTEQEQIGEQKHNEESARNITLVAAVLTLLITLAGSVFFEDLIWGKPWRLLICLVVILCMVPWSRFSWQRLKLVLGPMLGICLGPTMIGNWLHNGAVGGSIGLVTGVILGRLVGDWWLRNFYRITIQKVIYCILSFGMFVGVVCLVLFLYVCLRSVIGIIWTLPILMSVYGSAPLCVIKITDKIMGYKESRFSYSILLVLYIFGTFVAVAMFIMGLVLQYLDIAHINVSVCFCAGLCNQNTGGRRGSSGYFFDAGVLGYWWTATENGASGAYDRNMGYDAGNVYEDNDYKEYGFAVRCVGD